MVHAAARTVSDDSTLVLAMTKGDATAMSTLYDRYAPNLLGLALRITREQADAEEVVVDTFAQAWREASRFEAGRGSVAAWLATIARSRALDSIRSRTRRGRLSDAAAAEGAATDAPAMGAPLASPVANVIADEQSRRIRDALMELPDSQRAALDLAYFEGLSQSEIAERLGEPLGTVKTRVRLGLRKLRELLTALAPEGYP
ncbi:MAG: sigma-70 family RNA polymerase sigma factor [Gemmatimonadota bacterium]